MHGDRVIFGHRWPNMDCPEPSPDTLRCWGDAQAGLQLQAGPVDVKTGCLDADLDPQVQTGVWARNVLCYLFEFSRRLT